MNTIVTLAGLSRLAVVLGIGCVYVLYSEIRYMRMRLRLSCERHEQELMHKETQIGIMRNFLMKHIGVMRKVEAIISTPDRRMLLTDSEWRELEAFLESVDDLFVSRLRERFPDLSDSDLRLFMLLRVKMPARSLATFYGISEKSVKQKLFLYKAKVRLGDTSLREFVEHF